MPRITGRQARKGVADAVLLGARVSPANKAKAERAAEALGISMTTYVDELLSREQLDKNGRPLWWDKPTPRDQEELPLKSA